MSNDISSNPVYLDTFSSDITIISDEKPGVIKAITFAGDFANDKLSLEDARGHIKSQIRVVDSATAIFIPPNPIHFQGLVVDVSDGTYGGGGTSSQVAFIYL